MNRTVGLTLRRTAGGGVIFAIGLSVLSTRPQPPMPVVASMAALPMESVMPRNERPVRTTEAATMTLYTLATPPPTATAAAVLKIAPAVIARVARPARVAAAPKQAPVAPAATPPAAAPVAAAPGGTNAFAYGYCTWWVAHKRAIPWRGNAAEWWWNARAFGFAEGSAPRAGAVMVMGAGGAASSSGHVGYVEAVNADGSFLISEMNWWGVPGGGWGRVDYRTVHSMRGILGFIY